MKTSIYILSFLLVSCTVKPPELVVKGVQTEKALSFLKEHQNKTENKDQFDNYMQHLRLNYAPGFQWDEYWSGISERKLYKNLNQEELDQLLSLSQISCEQKDWIAFSNLLLQIAKDGGRLLFSRELNHSGTLCSVWLPNPVFKSIVQFLSEKRSELEKEKIAKEKIAYMNKSGQEILSGGRTAQQVKYTKELQKVLIEEWLRRHTGRNWSEVLDVVDRSFWSDVRYLSYLNGNREHLSTVLEMEDHLYKSIEAGLDLDILLMFEEPGKMTDIMKLVGYEKYLAIPGALDWGSLWKRMSVRYPSKPENGNVNSLLDFYKLKFSCSEKILSEYENLVRQWKASVYERAISPFCDQDKKDAVFAIYGPEQLNKYAEELSRSLMEKAVQETEETNRRLMEKAARETEKAVRKTEEASRRLMEKAARETEKAVRKTEEASRRLIEKVTQETKDKLNKSKYHLLDKSLGIHGRNLLVYDVPMSIKDRGSRSIQEIIALLYTFKSEQFDRTRKEWRTLFEKHFSDPDWLFAMRAFRDQGNSFLLSKLLDMHNFVYGDNEGNPGKISFLYADIASILDSEVVSLTGIADKYGYKKDLLYTDEIVSLFWMKLKSSLTENRESLKRVVSVYEEEKQLRTSKQWRELFKRHFVDQNWLNLLSLLREKVRRKMGEKAEETAGKKVTEEEDSPVKVKALLSGVLGMLYEVYEGGKPFFEIFEADVRSIIETERINLSEISEKYNYDKTYMKDMMEEADDLYWRRIRGIVENHPASLIKALVFYEREKQFRTPKEWREFFRKYFDERHWLNLMRFLQNKVGSSPDPDGNNPSNNTSKIDINKNIISRVLDMHYEISLGRISLGRIFFLKKAVGFILESEEITPVGIVNKYGYKYDYINTDEIIDLFWQKIKKSVDENPENLMKVLLVYDEERLLRTPEKWQELFEKYFDEQNWLSLVKLLTEKIRLAQDGKLQEGESLSQIKVNLSRVLTMHHEVYDGRIPFLEKYIQWIIESEGITPSEISEKYGIDSIYIEDIEGKVDDLFWQKLAESLEKNPGNLARVLSIYEREKARQPSDPPGEWRKKWQDIFKKYFPEQKWLNLMRFFQGKNDFPGISGVLDMHYTVYNGKIPFFQNYVQMVLRSKSDNQVHLSNINAGNGFRDIYVENHDVYYQFWNEIKKSVDKGKALNWERFLEEDVDQCDFSHIKDLFLFFSQFNQEYLLINQFKFKNCANFTDEFKGKEWDRLVSLIRRGEHRSGGTVKSSFVWWLARVLFLYSEEKDSLIKETVSKISALEWKNILRGILETYIPKSPEVDHYLFMETLNKVRLVYNDEVESVLCPFIAGEKSLSFIQEYDSELVMDFLYSLSWSRRSKFQSGRRVEKKYCWDLISAKDRNVLLYALSQSLFKKKDESFSKRGSVSRQDMVSEVWSVAVEIMDLSIKMNDFEESDIWSLSFKAFLNMRKEMNEYDFYLQFSDDILELLLSVSNGDRAFVSDHLVNHLWTEAPDSNYHAAYRGWIKELLRDKSDDYPYPPGSKRYVPLPYSLWSENIASSIGEMYDNWVKTLKSRPSSNYPWPPGGNKETGFSRDPDTISSALRSNKDKSRGVQSVSSDEESPKTDYGQIFIEETGVADDFDYEISVSGGLEGGNPYISSSFLGFEVKRRIHSVISLGLDYSFYNSKVTSTIEALENAYGLELSHPFLKHTMYFNGHYNVFRSHLNLAGFFKLRLDVPLQLGLGVMNMGGNDTHFSVRWGLGPRVRFGSRWGVQYLFSQSVSAREIRFLYTWHSLVLSVNF